MYCAICCNAVVLSEKCNIVLVKTRTCFFFCSFSMEDYDVYCNFSNICCLTFESSGLQMRSNGIGVFSFGDLWCNQSNSPVNARPQRGTTERGGCLNAILKWIYVAFKIRYKKTWKYWKSAPIICQVNHWSTPTGSLPHNHFPVCPV